MKEYNIALIGAGFMAKAHSMAYSSMPICYWPAPAVPVKKTIVDITEEKAAEAAKRFGFEKSSADWRAVVSDPEIDVVNIATPNDLHLEIAVAAAENGKHIFCEKPIARTVAEAEQMYDAVKKAGVKNMLGFNYRRTPAVLLAKEIIEKNEIGKILNFRGTYLQDWSASPSSPLSWRFQKDVAGSGALGDIGTHIIDMARFLVGDISEVIGRAKTYITERPKQKDNVDKLGTVQMEDKTDLAAVDVDDEVSFMVKFENDAFGSFEATRNGWGRNNFITFEIHGEKGSLFFNYENRDELQVYYSNDPSDRRGFRTIYSGPAHPYGEGLWPIPALGIGYSDTKIIECYDFFKSIEDNTESSPNFEDGVKIARICDAVLSSSESGSWVKL